jgi:hypothetical protein
MPAQQGPAPEQGGGDLAAIFKALTGLFSQLREAGADPKKIQQLAAIIKAFQMFASGEADQGQAPGGAAPMEAGVNPNARPM